MGNYVGSCFVRGQLFFVRGRSLHVYSTFFAELVVFFGFGNAPGSILERPRIIVEGTETSFWAALSHAPAGNAKKSRISKNHSFS